MAKKRYFLLITVVFLVIPAFFGVRSIVEALRKEKAYELTVNGKKWVTVSEKEGLDHLLSEYQKGYLTDIDKHARIKKISFVPKVQIDEVSVKPEEIDSLNKAKEKIDAVKQKAVEVEVKGGDSLWNIAQANQIPESDLEIFNPDMDPDKIFPGDKLVIKPQIPALEVKVELENTVSESIPFKVEYKKDKNLYVNQKKIIREGVEGQKEVDYHITLLNGYQRSLEVRGEKVLKQPVIAIIHKGTRTTAFRGGMVNYGVVSGKRVSSRFGFRIHPITGRKLFHEGLDIAANYGNGVYAYTDGRVIQTGWNGGYGKSILIDHGNGLKTRYGHLSKINVRVGQRVKTGEKIGAVGSTGSSTGPHLHFEVIKNGQTKNPLNYL